MDESKLSEALHRASEDVALQAPSRQVATRAKHRLKRNAILTTAAVVVAAIGSFAGYQLLRPDQVEFLNEPSEGPVQHSVRSTDGTLECTATLPTNVIQPGDPTGISLSTRNVSDSAVQVQRHFYGLLRVYDATGKLLQASTYGGFAAGPHFAPSIPAPLPTDLPSGGSVQLRVFDVPIRWPGELKIEVLCSTLDQDNPHIAPFDIKVAVPGSRPTRDVALANALDATDGLFAKCQPKSDGTWTSGIIEAPDGQYAPMTARCSAVFEEHPGFAVVGVRFVAPATAPEVDLAEGLWATELPGEASMSIARWSFVVTTTGVKEVEPLLGAARTRGSSGFSVGISHNDSGWHADSESICGGGAYYRGIVMISPCPP